MNKSIKNKMLVLLSAIAILFGCLASVFSFAPAYATGATITSQNFENLKIVGASMLLIDGDEGALRFGVECTNTEYDAISSEKVTSGVLIIPTDILGKKELTIDFSTKHQGVENVVPRNKIIDDCWEASGTTHMSSYVYLYNIPAESYTRSITARAYVVVDGQSEPYYSEQVERSIAYVAAAAAKDPTMANRLDVINKYRPTYTVNIYNEQEKVHTSNVLYGDSVDYVMEDSVDGQYVVKNTGWVDSKGETVSLDYVTTNMDVYAKTETLLNIEKTFDVELSNGGTLNLNLEFADFNDLTAPKAYLKTENGYEESEKLSLSNGVLTYNNDGVADVGEKSVIVSDGTNGYAFDITVVTKVITTAQELDAIYAGYGNNPTADNNYSYGGYFVLGNNIDATGVRIWEKLGGPSFSYNADPIDGSIDYGFIGTLDGRGFTISNISTAGPAPTGVSAAGGYGIFGHIGKTAVIKNVAFTNVQCGTSSGVQHSILGLYMGGTVENVYLETTGAFVSVFRQTQPSTDIDNLIVYAPNMTKYVSEAFYYGQTYREPQYTNVVLVNNATEVLNHQYGKYYSFNQAEYKNDADFLAYDFEGKFTSDVWIVENGKLPCFYRMIMNKEIIGTVNSTITLPLNNGETATLADNYAGVTLDGKTLNVESTCTTAEIVINVANSIHDATYTITVYLPITKELSGDALYDTNGTTGLSIDLSQEGVSTVDEIYINSVKVDASKYAISEGIITLSRENFEALNLAIGDYAFSVKSKGATYNGQLKVVTKVITTAQELDTIYAGYGNNPTADNNYSYGGYFVLGNNIDATGVRIWENLAGTFDYSAPAIEGSIDYGFIGTLDGRGFTIRNISTAGRSPGGNITGGGFGIFGHIGQTAVIKNVAFTNVQCGTLEGVQSLLGVYMSGKVENVYLETPGTFVSVFRQTQTGTDIDNLIVYAPNMTNYVSQAFLYGQTYREPQYTNVVLVNNATEVLNHQYGKYYSFNQAEYKNDADFLAYDFEGKFTSDVWQFVEGDLPIFKNMDAE